MQLKYTSDGKKVAIVGKLNAEQTIVQEIYITESGQEIPSGENFVVTSLHDQPVKKWSTYYEDRCKEQEKSNEYRLSQLKDQATRLYTQLERYKKSIDQFVQGVPEHLSGLLLEAARMLSPENKWIAYRNYTRYYVKEYLDHFGGEYSVSLRVYFNGIRSSVYVATDDIRYDDFDVFKTKEEAVAWIENYINSKTSLNEYDIEASLKYGFELDAVKLEDYKNRTRAQKQKEISELEGKLATLKSNLESI